MRQEMLGGLVFGAVAGAGIDLFTGLWGAGIIGGDTSGGLFWGSSDTSDGGDCGGGDGGGGGD